MDSKLEMLIEIAEESLKETKKQPEEVPTLKRKRGRPPKNPSSTTDCIAKRTRGRPRKSSPSPLVKFKSKAKNDKVLPTVEKIAKIVKSLRKFEENDSTSEGQSDDRDFLFPVPTQNSSKKRIQYRCRFCNFRTYYKNTYLIHMERYDETPGSFQCHLCDKSLPLRRELESHWRSHMPTYFPDGLEKPGFYECDMCDVKFPKRFQLGRHRQAHQLNFVSQETFAETQPRKMKRCNICGKRFNSEVALFKHMEKATDEHEPVECDICKKIFRSKRNLIMHLRIHVGPLICHICGSRKYSEASMKVHIRRHNKDYHTRCDKCNKGFYNKSELRLHMISHTNRETNRPFICQICGRSYRSGCYLKLHVKIAHVEAEEYKRKRYKCDICDFETHLLKCLKIHKQTHTGENLINCELCNKMINRRYMPIHIRTHTGEKPFDCSICGKGFNCKKNLVRHHSRKHQMKM